jgi:hypothetical protein
LDSSDRREFLRQYGLRLKLWEAIDLFAQKGAAMNVVLNIFFAGLIGFVPSSDGRKVEVMLVDATSEEEVGGCMTHEHIPALVVRYDSVAGKCEDFGGKKDGEDGEFCSWNLKKVRVKIGNLANQEFRRLSGIRGGSIFRRHELPSKESEVADISWLSELASIIPGAGRIREDIANGSSHEAVAARIALDHGNLRVCHLVDDGHSYVESFDFKELRTGGAVSGYHQSLADEVGLQAGMDSNFLTIYREKFDGSGEELPINLRAREGRLDIMILNLPDEEVSIPCYCKDVGVDFIRYYKWVSRDPRVADRFFIPVARDTMRPKLQQMDCEDSIVREFRPPQEDTCDVKGSTPVSLFTRPICPMAAFEF